MKKIIISIISLVLIVELGLYSFVIRKLRSFTTL